MSSEYFAFYNVDGRIVERCKDISAHIQLPVNLFADLKNDYSKYWISEPL